MKALFNRDKARKDYLTSYNKLTSALAKTVFSAFKGLNYKYSFPGPKQVMDIEAFDNGLYKFIEEIFPKDIIMLDKLYNEGKIRIVQDKHRAVCQTLPIDALKLSYVDIGYKKTLDADYLRYTAHEIGHVNHHYVKANSINSDKPITCEGSFLGEVPSIYYEAKFEEYFYPDQKERFKKTVQRFMANIVLAKIYNYKYW